MVTNNCDKALRACFPAKSSLEQFRSGDMSEVSTKVAADWITLCKYVMPCVRTNKAPVESLAADPSFFNTWYTASDEAFVYWVIDGNIARWGNIVSARENPETSDLSWKAHRERLEATTFTRANHDRFLYWFHRVKTLRADSTTSGSWETYFSNNVCRLGEDKPVKDNDHEIQRTSEGWEILD